MTPGCTLIALSRCLLLAACLAPVQSCATTFGPAGFAGGYTEEKLDDARFEVRFSGNVYTSASQVHRFLLRRCAQLAQQMGFAYFTVTQQAVQVHSTSPAASKESTEAEEQMQDGFAGGAGVRAMGPRIVEEPVALDRHTESCVMQGHHAGAQPQDAFDVAVVLAEPL